MVVGFLPNQGLVYHQPNAMFFDGVDDYVDTGITEPTQFQNGFTISAMIRPNGAGESNTGRIVDKSAGTNAQNGFAYYVGTADVVYLNVNGSSTNSALNSVVIGDGKWYHIVVTVTADALVTHYINGVQSGTPGTVGALSGITTTNDLRIGNRSTATDRTFDGDIKELAIWNWVLSPEQIVLVYNYALSPIKATDNSRGTVSEGPGSVGTRVVMKGHPAVEGLTAGIRKQTGVPYLVEQESI